jgi:hypothetical protein
MVRTGTQEYTCQESGEVFSLRACLATPSPEEKMSQSEYGKALYHNHVEVYGRELLANALNIFAPKE